MTRGKKKTLMTALCKPALFTGNVEDKRRRLPSNVSKYLLTQDAANKRIPVEGCKTTRRTGMRRELTAV